MQTVELRVGCPMWAHKAWQGRFVPERLDRSAALSAYATWCTAVEGNTTFYGLPSTTTVASWADATPETFRFVFKLPRVVTHERRLRDVTAPMREFLALVEPLGPRARTLSVQLPASFGPTELDVLDRFLGRMPAAHRCGVEVRHPDFFTVDAAGRPTGAGAALTDLLARRDAEWISFDTTVLFSAPPTSEAERDGWEKKPRLPRRDESVGDEPIVRYVGRDDVDATVDGWVHWVDRVADWLAEGRTPTFFLHTPDNDRALGLARRFHEQVRERVPELDPLPEPVVVESAASEPSTLF
jgi:uncharacterized protein YecE (DUF72 family)